VLDPNEKVEVVIDSENVLVTYPAPAQPFYTVNVNYHKAFDVMGSLFLPVSDWYKERVQEFLKQLSAAKGALYDDYVKRRDQAIREDLQKRLATGPRRVVV